MRLRGEPLPEMTAGGLSAGGAAAAIMGAAYPHLYAAVGVPFRSAAGSGTRYLFRFRRHASGRPVRCGRVPPQVGASHADHRVPWRPRQDGQPRQWRTGMTVSVGESEGGVRYARAVQADQTGRPVLEHWVLHGVGHAWSGGSPPGSYTDPRGPDASREMLRFFLEQQKPAAASLN